MKNLGGYVVCDKVWETYVVTCSTQGLTYLELKVFVSICYFRLFIYSGKVSHLSP